MSLSLFVISSGSGCGFVCGLSFFSTLLSPTAQSTYVHYMCLPFRDSYVKTWSEVIFEFFFYTLESPQSWLLIGRQPRDVSVSGTSVVHTPNKGSKKCSSFFVSFLLFFAWHSLALSTNERSWRCREVSVRHRTSSSSFSSTHGRRGERLTPTKRNLTFTQKEQCVKTSWAYNYSLIICWRSIAQLGLISYN